MTTQLPAAFTIARTADIVSAYLSHNAVRPADVPAVIAMMHEAILNLGAPKAEPVPTTPSATLIRQSVKPAGLVSFLDGKTYKTLKRHLTKHGHTPDSYRAAFGLPADYPMVAPNYAERRSAIAKKLGFGRVSAR